MCADSATSVCLSVCLSVSLSVGLSVGLPVGRSVCLSVRLSVCPPVCLFVCWLYPWPPRLNFEGLEVGEDGPLEMSKSWSRSIEDLHQTGSQPFCNTLVRSARQSVLRYVALSLPSRYAITAQRF